MGVFSPQILIYGQIFVLLCVLNNVTNASESLHTTATAPPLNATGNHTEKKTSHAPSYSENKETPTPQYNFTTVEFSNISANRTSAPTQNNATDKQTNTTENKQTSTTFSTINITLTPATFLVNSSEKATSSNKPATQTTLISPTQNGTISFTKSQGLTHSDKFLTIFFSVLLGLIILVILAHFVYKFSRSKERSVQYTHRRLQNEETGEQFAVPDDTLVISGGLYDGPQIYNPRMSVQTEEESQTDSFGFGSIPAQFRLEFLREDQE